MKSLSKTHLKIRRLYLSLSNKLRHEFHRRLPIGELIFDRWERAKQYGFGKNANIYESVCVLGDVEVGEETYIGPNCYLDGQRAPIKIGKECDLSAGVQVFTHDSVRQTISGQRLPIEVAPVIIEDNVYIGPCVLISKGVTIGHHSVIGAHSFVNSDIPPFSKAWGIPCRIKGSSKKYLKPSVETAP